MFQIMKMALHLPIVAALLTVAGKLSAQTPTQRPSASGSTESLRLGKSVYEQHCAACHGLNGEGNGPAAVWLYPKPRHFNSGLFKIKSTPAGFLPMDEDLFQTVTRGMPGSSMPSFTYLTEKDRRDVVQYIKDLTARVDASGKRINFFEEATAEGKIAASVDVPPEPPVTVQSLALGQDVYSKMNCFT